MLQAEKSLVWFPIIQLKFFIDIALPVAYDLVST
jgi:hypothetical protein